LKGKDIDEKVGVIINIGSETTNISIFNKGVMIKNAIIEVGSKFIDNDISYIYKIDRKTARRLKETFAVSSKRYADITDTVEVENKSHETIKINQHEISNIVEERLIQILKLAKKQISILTNREISYIIITGGISELPGFQYVVDTIFNENAYTANSTILGIRSNKYTTAIGIIKYFYKKLEFREKENYTMFDDKKCYDLVSSKKKMNLSINAIFEKVFGYF
jgi:cell division protein FtsA